MRKKSRISDGGCHFLATKIVLSNQDQQCFFSEGIVQGARRDERIGEREDESELGFYQVSHVTDIFYKVSFECT